MRILGYSLSPRSIFSFGQTTGDIMGNVKNHDWHICAKDYEFGYSTRVNFKDPNMKPVMMHPSGFNGQYPEQFAKLINSIYPDIIWTQEDLQNLF